MKKVALVFLLAVFVPSLVLAWLALRSLRDQQFVLERQQLLLYQTVTDSLAQEINNYIAEQQREFNAHVEKLVAGDSPRLSAAAFDERLRAQWPLAEIGFCVTITGSLLCPSPNSSPQAKYFCEDNGRFLANRESAEVYWNDLGNKGGNFNTALNAQQTQAPQVWHLNAADTNTAYSQNNVWNLKSQTRKVNPSQQPGQSLGQSQIAPSQEANVSKVVPAEAEFRQLIGEGRDGMMARFLQNKLKLMFWHRLEKDPQLVFGAQLNLEQITRMVRLIVQGKTKSNYRYTEYQNVNRLAPFFPDSARPVEFFPDEICLLVLDDNARPVASSDANFSYFLDGNGGTRPREPIDSNFRSLFKTDLKNPFVATEIGDALPHWEIAAYLRNPDGLKRTARTIQLTLGLLIGVLVLAIGVGSWLIVGELNRHLTLARQKTDFVSNVSHELKTPLTSIRMFSELLAEGRVSEQAKQRSYLNIITAETARLTRLINNVLDFSRMERGEKKYNFQDSDLASIVRDTAETYRPHLENNGFKLDCQLPVAPLAVRGDADALAQIIVNLLSNAEKYSNGQKEIEIRVSRHDAPLPHAEVKVLDRGPGVPRECAEKIFEQFYRAHDSLSSGVQGSGLGLTLARQIARAHGGDVVYEAREGGGSCFALRLPLKQS